MNPLEDLRDPVMEARWQRRRPDAQRIQTRKVNQMQRHELSAKYPSHDKDDMARLVASMEENGYDPLFPVVVFEGKILDGFNRWAAAKRAGVTPAVREFFGSREDAERFAKAANLARRHLTKTQIASLEIVKFKIDNPGKEVPSVKIARQAGIGPTAVSRMAKYPVDDLQKVAEGELSASAIGGGSTKREKAPKFAPHEFVGRLHFSPAPKLSQRIHNIICTTRGLTEAKAAKEAFEAWCEKYEAPASQN